MNNVEFRISQYADDTSVIIGGSESSLKQTISELERFSRISGLNINFDKTQLIRITKWKLSWGKRSFKVLGITFNTNLEKMIKENYNSKIQQVKKRIKQWGEKKLNTHR